MEVRSRHRSRLGRRRRLLRRQQPRRGAVEGQDHLDLARRPAVLAQQGDRRDGVGAQGRGPRHRRDDHARSARRPRHRHRRRRRRRIRHPRLDRRHRSQHRQAGVAHLHDPGRRRARQRDLEGRQGALEAWRRLGLGDRDLRSRDRHVLPGHRQCRPGLGSGIPAGRQQVGGERARAQPGRRQDQVGLPVHAQRSL